MSREERFERIHKSQFHPETLLLVLIIIVFLAYTICAVSTFLPYNPSMVNFWMETAKTCLSFIIGVLVGRLGIQCKLEKEKSTG